MRWKLRARLKVARFDEGALVFNPVSWQTHLLNDSAVRALDVLSARPSSLGDLVAAILGDPARGDWSAEELGVAEALLVELETLGLVVAIDSAVPCG
jgi:PqqD family protein of HPr-rel-A system